MVKGVLATHFQSYPKTAFRFFSGVMQRLAPLRAKAQLAELTPGIRAKPASKVRDATTRLEYAVLIPKSAIPDLVTLLDEDSSFTVPAGTSYGRDIGHPHPVQRAGSLRLTAVGLCKAGLFAVTLPHGAAFELGRYQANLEAGGETYTLDVRRMSRRQGGQQPGGPCAAAGGAAAPGGAAPGATGAAAAGGAAWGRGDATGAAAASSEAQGRGGTTGGSAAAGAAQGHRGAAGAAAAGDSAAQGRGGAVGGAAAGGSAGDRGGTPRGRAAAGGAAQGRRGAAGAPAAGRATPAPVDAAGTSATGGTARGRMGPAGGHAARGAQQGRKSAAGASAADGAAQGRAGAAGAPAAGSTRQGRKRPLRPTIGVRLRRSAGAAGASGTGGATRRRGQHRRPAAAAPAAATAARADGPSAVQGSGAAPSGTPRGGGGRGASSRRQHSGSRSHSRTRRDRSNSRGRSITSRGASRSRGRSRSRSPGRSHTHTRSHARSRRSSSASRGTNGGASGKLGGSHRDASADNSGERVDHRTRSGRVFRRRAGRVPAGDGSTLTGDGRTSSTAPRPGDGAGDGGWSVVPSRRRQRSASPGAEPAKRQALPEQAQVPEGPPPRRRAPPPTLLHNRYSVLAPGGAAAQRRFIADHLAPAATLPGLKVWAGDYNFVCNAAIDTLHRGGRLLDPGTTSLFASTCASPVDSFRHLHPTRRSFTFINHMGASRIDRIMLSPELLSSLRACAHVPGRPSDHRLVVATLAPVDGAVSPGPGLRRLSDAYLAFPDLRRSLLDWNRGACAAAPEAPVPLLRWFVAYKRDLVRTVGRLNRIARGRILEETAEEAAARAAEAAALAVVEAGGPDAAQAAAAAVAARSAAAAAAQRAVARHARAARLQWLRTRETASPAITRLVRPPGGAARIAAIRRPDGSVCDSLPEIPTHIVDYWRRISAAVATDPDACDRVLAALAAFGRRCTDEDAVRPGADTVSSAEVEAALAAAPAGSTPGRDGIPAELYRELGGPTARVLARVFTASLAAGAPPRGFLDGVITCFSKPGDPLQPSSYRPITLLGTDYRTLARVLARRLIPVFSNVIHPAQTAFLPGRRIADNVLLLQLLPELMRVAEGGGPGGGGGGGGAAGSTADADRGVVAFLDFYKAYDTLDRNFLYRCLAVMGVGSGFLAWVKLLLTGTRSAALANGYLSAFVLIIAGVRQGCPLAPPLYLAPAQALFAYLDRAGFGVSWADIRLVATAYADDAAPFLRRMANVPGFLAAMETFRAASGQRLNLDKVELLPIGARRRATPAPARAVAAGLAAGGAAAGNMAAHGVAATSVAAAGGMAAGGAAAGVAVAGGGPGASHSGGGSLAAGGAVPSRAGAVWAAAGVVVTGGVTAGGSAAGAGGAVAAPAPPNTVAMAHGLRVVSHSRTLGVVFYDLPLGTAAAQGAPSLSPAIGTLGTLCGLPLTAFGRGFCASSYAVSRVLYHMEFAGLPPQTVLADFLKTLVRFVDRRIIVASPQGAGRARLPGLPSDCVALPPRDGGFGLLPVVEHVRARHAVLAVRWLQHMHGSAAGTYVPPWTAAATALVQQLHTAAHPLCVLTMQRAAGGVGPAADGCAIFGQPVAATCPALVRLLGALSYLPPVTILRPAVLVPGPWCFALPLWGNPVLPCAAGLQAGGLERDFPALMALPGLLTLGTAVRCWEALAAVRQLVASKPAGALGPRLARRCTMQYKRSVLRPILRIADMARVPPELQSGPDAAAQFSALLARMAAACAEPGVAAWRG
ncbi:hypothetical protein CHLRE_10g444044v5 [Chlamydomonas reinhardtii]|uniref:Reverse transcriptase domain-containing protein n=1 Tax=Chlamydomonas reinhardtii TaxID=3055 RepID=A0A2K3DAP3_CHLRE|nr:uncharacterized protein CHLRE_10g444044v5 [Chlamydomonas reinhardtii]PNW77603.1 hypothetical protein CHLRE_10g444044v5 [Chlamydomonas reinhardtii]